MNLDELDQLKQAEPPPTTIRITHMASLREENGEVVRVPLEIYTGDPDFHLGAVGGE